MNRSILALVLVVFGSGSALAEPVARLSKSDAERGAALVELGRFCGLTIDDSSLRRIALHHADAWTRKFRGPYAQWNAQRRVEARAEACEITVASIKRDGTALGLKIIAAPLEPRSLDGVGQ